MKKGITIHTVHRADVQKVCPLEYYGVIALFLHAELSYTFYANFTKYNNGY